MSTEHADSEACGDACEWTVRYKSGPGEEPREEPCAEPGKVRSEARDRWRSVGDRPDCS